MSAVIIPSDAPSIFDQLTTADGLAIVRPNNPPPGIAGYLFPITGDEELRFRTQITRHYTEAGTPVQDQACLEPEEITVKGVVAELATGLPAVAPQAKVNNALPLNPVMVPELAPGPAQTLAQTTAATAAASAGAQSSQSLYAYYQANTPQQPGQTKQSNAAAFLYQLWKGRALFSVETAFGIMNNMMILDGRCLQEAETREKSLFTLIFQKVRIAGDATVQLGQLAGRRVFQVGTVAPNGIASQTVPTTAELNRTFQSFAPTTP